MIQIRRGIRPEEVRADGEHVLFVEGKEDGSLDQAVLRALLGNKLRIAAMGGSFHVRSAAQALARHHPKYYFLIDRDHSDDDVVQRSWERFPNADSDNLLVWNRREIENYFLDPPFLVESEFCRTTEKELTNTLESAAQERLFFDVANSVISSIREEQKSNWIKHYNNLTDFSTKDAALRRLTSDEAFRSRSIAVADMVSEDQLTERFENNLKSMTGGREQLAYGTGRWIEMIKGKPVLNQLLNSGGFTVQDARGQKLRGDEMKLEIVKELAVKEVDSRPSDLVKLKQMIQNQLAR